MSGVVLVGGGALARAVLEGLIASGHPVAGVVILTQGPESSLLERLKRPVKRGLAALGASGPALGLMPLAARHRLRMVFAHRVGTPAAADRIASLGPDRVLVASLGEILPETFLARWPGRVWNLHPSLLPEDRGPAPAASALRRGASQTGVTLHRMTMEVDCGDLLLQKTLPIVPGETVSTLEARLASLAREAVREAFRDPAALEAAAPGERRPG